MNLEDFIASTIASCQLQDCSVPGIIKGFNEIGISSTAALGHMLRDSGARAVVNNAIGDAAPPALYFCLKARLPPPATASPDGREGKPPPWEERIGSDASGCSPHDLLPPGLTRP